MPTIATLLQLGALVAESAVRIGGAAAEARALIDQLARENRDPTDEEWERLRAVTDGLHEEIQRG